jgi:hypothetical protein
MGTVVKAWYREAEWAEGTWTAYQVMLDTGQYIYAPVRPQSLSSCTTGPLSAAAHAHSLHCLPSIPRWT